MSSELPVDFGRKGIAASSPGAHLFAEAALIGQAALLKAAHDANLNLSHIQPAAMFRRVMPLKALHQSAGFFRRKCFVKRSWSMLVEIVRNQNDLFCSGVKDIGSILKDMGKIQSSPCFRDNSLPLACQEWFTDHKNISDAVADIHRIYFLRLSRFTRDPCFLYQLLVRLIYADHRVERVVGTLIYFQNILHLCHKFSVRLWDAPFLYLPRLEFVFFIILHTVLSVM